MFSLYFDSRLDFPEKKHLSLPASQTHLPHGEPKEVGEETSRNLGSLRGPTAGAVGLTGSLEDGLPGLGYVVDSHGDPFRPLRIGLVKL